MRYYSLKTITFWLNKSKKPKEMERHTLVMDWKTNVIKMLFSSKWSIGLYAITIKMPAGIFVANSKIYIRKQKDQNS